MIKEQQNDIERIKEESRNQEKILKKMKQDIEKKINLLSSGEIEMKVFGKSQFSIMD